MTKKIIFCLLFFKSLLSFADLEFRDYTLVDNRIIFTLISTCPQYGSYKTLFGYNLAEKNLMQYTFFPEEITYLKALDVLQIQNRYGVFRTDANLKNIIVLKDFPSFIGQGVLEEGKIVPLATAPNGRYLVYFKATSLVWGNLFLYDLIKPKEILVAENVPLSYRNLAVSWSPDSKLFVYAKEGKLYFFSIEYLEKDRLLAENYRNFGKGSLSCVQWDNRSGLFYIEDYVVTKIESAEFLARSLYAGSVNIGTIVGKLPFKFSPALDRFWIAPDGRKILFSKGNQNLFFFYLVNNDYTFSDPLRSLPHLFLPRSLQIEKVIWSLLDDVTILACGREKGRELSRLFRLKVLPDGTVKGFNQLPEQNVSKIILSEDQSNLLLIYKDKVDIYNYADWKKTAEIAFKGALNSVWKSKNEVILAGLNTIELYDLAKKTFSLIAVSQVEEIGVAQDKLSILIKTGSQLYSSKMGETVWTRALDFKVLSPVTQNSDYRLYLENLSNQKFRNMLYVRDLKGLATFQLVTLAVSSYEDFPKEEEPVDFVLFNHGSRLRQREVALVFNAVYSLEGLSEILTVLREYGVSCTFFINGEFMRRYPEALKEIAASGHEIGSLFYTYFDMTDSRYTIDTDFIKKGLARNEDEYFKLTGKELSLLWHAPYYFVNSSIIEASRQMNYSYIGRDVDSLDWVGRLEALTSGVAYYNGAQLVERILKLKKPGSIIPIEIGVTSETRDDYLFQYLDLLLCGLEKLGYKVVTVSTLQKHAR